MKELKKSTRTHWNLKKKINTTNVLNVLKKLIYLNHYLKY